MGKNSKITLSVEPALGQNRPTQPEVEVKSQGECFAPNSDVKYLDHPSEVSARRGAKHSPEARKNFRKSPAARIRALTTASRMSEMHSTSHFERHDKTLSPGGRSQVRQYDCTQAGKCEHRNTYWTTSDTGSCPSKRGVTVQ